MKVIRVGRSCLLGMLAISAVAVSSASAAEYEPKGLPEAGRCVKVGLGKGVYRGGHCIAVAAPGKGSYEWMPANATEKLKWSGSGVEPVLKTVGHGQIKCLTMALAGEWASPKVAQVTMQGQGCLNSNEEACQSTGTKSELMSATLEGELGFIKNEVKEGKIITIVGLDLKSPAPLITYECGGKITEPMKLEGSVIGKVNNINVMTTKMNLVYSTRTNGEQIYTKFQGGPEDTLFTTFQEGLGSTTAPTTLKIKEYVGSNASPVEIKSKETFPS